MLEVPNSYNWFYVGLEKVSANIRLGAIEEKLYDICREKLGSGEQEGAVLYRQLCPEPYNRAFLVIERNGPQWKPWKKEQRDEFRSFLRQKVEILKSIYCDILPDLLRISSQAAIEINENKDSVCWDQATLRSMLAKFCSLYIHPLPEMKSIIYSTVVNENMASVNFQRDFGALELNASASISEKGFIFSISAEPFLLDFQQEIVSQGAVLKAVPNQNTWIEQICFDDKNILGHGLTAWFSEFTNKFQIFLPVITQLTKTLQTKINALESLVDSVDRRLRILFPAKDGWIICNNARNLSKFSKISIYKHNWAIDKDNKFPLMSFELEQESSGFRQLKCGIQKGDSFKKLPSYVKEMITQVFLQQFSDHVVAKLAGCNDFFLYIDFNSDYENNIENVSTEEFLNYIESLFGGLKKLSPLVDGCVAGIKEIEK